MVIPKDFLRRRDYVSKLGHERMEHLKYKILLLMPSKQRLRVLPEISQRKQCVVRVAFI
jgi:hypothetical protein